MSLSWPGRAVSLLAVAALLAGCANDSRPSSASQSDQTDDQIRTARLFSPTAGWVLTGNRLLTTSDAGGTWRNVTPARDPGTAHLETAFFLNPTQAWAVVRGARENSGSYLEGLDLYGSSDGGRHWTFHHLPATIPIDTGGPVYLTFLDSTLGWMVVDQGSHAGFMRFTGYRTTDGGRTWKTAQLPQSAPLLFINGRDGFSSGLDNGPKSGTFVTHDGGDSWARMPMQKVDGATVSPVFELPVFSDAVHGVLLGRLPQSTGDAEDEVFYETSDGGRSWRLATRVANPTPQTSSGGGGVINETDWLAGFFVGVTSTTSTRFEVTHDGGRTWTWSSTIVPGWLREPISFAGSTGWGIFNQSGCRSFKSDCFSYDDLMQTDDAGTHWRPLSFD